VQRIAGMGDTHERMANDMGLMAKDYRLIIAYSIWHEPGATGLWLMTGRREEQEEKSVWLM
jgi:hypothetical protein